MTTSLRPSFMRRGVVQTCRPGFPHAAPSPGLRCGQLKFSARQRSQFVCKSSLPDRSQGGQSISLGTTPPDVDLLDLGNVPAESPINKEQATVDMSTEDNTWTNWLEYFSEIEECEVLQDDLNMELEEAVVREQYSEASKLKIELEDAKSKDTVQKLKEQLADAIASEQFSKAAKLRDEAQVGLEGWWVARGKDDPCGQLVHISSGFSRYIGKSYTTKDIAVANGWTDQTVTPFGEAADIDLEEMGQPALEVFLKQDADGAVEQQACALKVPAATENPDGSLSLPEIGEDVMVESEKDDDGNVVKMTVTFMGRDGQKGDQDAQSDSQDLPDPQDPIVDLEDPQSAASTSGDDLGSDSGMNFGYPALEVRYRVPAAVEWRDRDHFVLNVEEDRGPPVGLMDEEGNIVAEDGAPSASGMVQNVEVEVIGNRELSERLSEGASSSAEVLEEIAETMKRMQIGSKSPGSKVAYDKQDLSDMLGSIMQAEATEENVSKILELLAINIQEDFGFEGDISFSRIPTEHPKTDPFSGLYLGAFGPHGPELLLLRRTQWEDGEECVEGLKLTGDPNVPAGEVSFRVKVGRKFRLESRGIYPEELGIVARYKGQGRVAEHGFCDPRWVEGELLQFSSGGGTMLTGGAELGFVWAVPGSRRFLILLNRLQLPS